MRIGWNGGDHPTRLESIRDEARRAAADGLEPAARRAIDRDNALALLPRLRQRVEGAGDA